MRQVDTIVLVNDITESKAFYSNTMGLEVLHDWGSMVVFQNRLALHQMDLLQPPHLVAPFLDRSSIGAANLVLYLSTENLEDELTRLSGLGVEVVHGIIELPWQRIFRVRDNNGYLIEIGEEQTPGHSSGP